MKQIKKLNICFSMTLDLEGHEVPDRLFEILRAGHIVLDDLDSDEISQEQAAAFQWAAKRLQEATDMPIQLSWRAEEDCTAESTGQIPDSSMA